MRTKCYIPFIVAIAFLLFGCNSEEKKPQYNVLFIMIDDLRPQLGCYGDELVKSPKIDKLAEQSLLFNRAYCQSAVCSPSRNSMLSGLRPNTTGLHGFGTHLRDVVPDAITLPQQFKLNGYESRAFGKIFHIYDESMLGNEDDPQSWSEPQQLPTVPVWGPEQNALRDSLIAVDKANGKEYNHPHDWPRAETWDDSDIPDDEMQDGNTTAMAINYLKTKKNSDEPFFLAIGYLRPHLPFNAPKKYWDLYDLEDITLPDFRQMPKNAPEWTMLKGMVPNYHNMPDFETIDPNFLKKYIQAYLACISYVDACVGRVMKTLEETGQAENTIVVLLGDHGYHMGEYDSWGHKATNYELSCRAPLIVHTPDMKTAGDKTNEIVEFLDLYPTLCELANIPTPKNVEGESFVNLIYEKDAQHKGYAISEKTRGARLGISIRTNEYRYTEWHHSKTGKLLASELYDHQNDIGNDVLEKENVAGNKENEGVILKFREQIKNIMH